MATYHIIKQKADGLLVVGQFEASDKGSAKALAADVAIKEGDGEYVMALQIGDVFAVQTRARVEGLTMRSAPAAKPNGKAKTTRKALKKGLPAPVAPPVE